MKICITGASGFIGKELTKKLSIEGNHVAILTRENNGQFAKEIAVFTGDLSKKNCDLSGFLAGVDVIFHCAAEINDQRLMHAVNVEGTQRLISAVINECSLRQKQVHWVQLSSCGAYGPPIVNVESERTVTEITETRPINEYEKTKTKSDEILISAFRKSSKLSFSILRPSNVIGPNMKRGEVQKMEDLIKSKKFFFIGEKGAVAPYVHIVDVVNALILLSKDCRARGQIYNLSSDCTIERLVESIADEAGVKPPKLYFPIKVVRPLTGLFNKLLSRWIKIPEITALIRRTHYPSTKIETDLGFTFSKPMPEGVTDVVRR